MPKLHQKSLLDKKKTLELETGKRKSKVNTQKQNINKNTNAKKQIQSAYNTI